MKGRVVVVVVVVDGTVVGRAPLIFAVKSTTMIFGSKKHVYEKTTESYGAQIIL